MNLHRLSVTPNEPPDHGSTTDSSGTDRRESVDGGYQFSFAPVCDSVPAVATEFSRPRAHNTQYTHPPADDQAQCINARKSAAVASASFAAAEHFTDHRHTTRATRAPPPTTSAAAIFLSSLRRGNGNCKIETSLKTDTRTLAIVDATQEEPLLPEG